MIISELRQRYPLKDLLQLSRMARSTFYYYLKNAIQDKHEQEEKEIVSLFEANKGRYGYRRILSELRGKGYTINHKTVLKLMKKLGLKSKKRKNEKYHSYKETIERVFADAKEKHAMRYTYYRGLAQVANWVRLKFAAMNIKKFAKRKFLDKLLDGCLFSHYFLRFFLYEKTHPAFRRMSLFRQAAQRLRKISSEAFAFTDYKRL